MYNIMKLFLKSRFAHKGISPVVKDEAKDMNALYMRIEKLMKEKSPYLDGDFTIKDLSHSVYHNRAYVSKTINKVAKVNFRNYINSYRIKYAVELIKKDPRIKISEVASLSGFNSLPTFNSSFKDVMSMRPSEYLCELRAHRPLFSSKMIE